VVFFISLATKKRSKEIALYKLLISFTNQQSGRKTEQVFCFIPSLLPCSGAA